MEDIIKILGGTAIAIGSSMAYKALVSHLLGKDVEIFKSKIKYEAEHGNHLLMQKIELYKEASNPIIDLIVKAQHQGTLSKEDLQKFDKDRLATTSLLAMFAPAEVFDEFNNMIDCVYDSFEGKQEWSFNTFRIKAVSFLSKVRKDIGLFEDVLSYKGTR